MSDQPHLLTERRGHVLLVTMNRPEAKNALSSEMLARMYDAWVELSEDPELRVGILTGAGGTFCSGMDLKAFATGFQETEWTKRFQEDDDLHWKALLRHYRPTKPLIAAVEGYCYAGGMEILQAFDLRVAGEGAKLGITEVQRSLFPMGGSTVRLPRQIPWAIAMEMLITGEPITGQRAYDIGLVGHVVPDGTTVERARELAQRIAANGPLAVKAIKASVLAADALPEVDAYQRESELGMEVMASNDAREGPRAFLEKRTPNYTGT